MNNISSAKPKMLLLHSLRNCNTILLGNKNYSKKLFSGAVNVVVSAAVWGILRPLVVSRNKSLVGSIDEAELTNKFPFVTDTNL